MKNVEEAQTAVVRAIRTLEESGQIVLARGGDEFVA
jgi:flagellar motor switch protein FliG